MPKKKNPKAAELKKRVAKLPAKPGVYRWLDAKGTVLYVGKALNLRKRVISYLSKDARLGPWKQSLMEKAADVSVTVTNSELEALILETNLIKQKKPKYNVLMKDDKNYVYVRIAVQDAFPRIDLVRKPAEDKAKYFGPYVSAFEIRETLTLLRRVFPYRTCKMCIEPTAESSEVPSPKSQVLSPLSVTVTHRDRPTPCLDYHIKQCCGPCIGLVSPEEYGRMAVEGVIDFLKGKTDDALALLTERMKTAARDRKFEQAAKLRDALQVIQRLSEKQIVSDTTGEDADIFGVAVEGNRVHVVLLKERNGKVIDESSFTLLGHAENAAEALTQFLPQYYVDAPDVPPLLIFAENIEDPKLLTEWLSKLHGSKVMIRIPERGKLPALLRLAEENAREKVQHFETSWEAAARNVEDALKELKTTLDLPSPPKRIEGYDISHLSGTETVGSMSVFVDGKPKNDQYRSYTIRTMKEGDIDDYRAIKEVLKRRLLHLTQNLREEEQTWKEQGITFGKARTDDAETIRKIMRDEPEHLSLEKLNMKDFLVARYKNTIVAFARLLTHGKNEVEMKSVWVRDDHRHQGLGNFIIRKLLAQAQREKLKKIYIRIFVKMEAYYATIGFRPAQVLPPILGKKIQAVRKKHPDIQGLTMVYIFAEHKKQDVSLGTRPDLLLIDGGKGQLSAAEEILRELNQNIPVISLAKREEEVFATGNPQPLSFAKDSPARFLLMRLRDEAHRFANQHRETRLKKRAVFSVLDSIPGIGPQTRVKLLKKFGSLEAIKDAPDEELLKILSQSQLATFRGQL
ncbi:MAG: GNAT family N-acetyltransferase [Candidatus Peribacter sp.]